MKIGIISDTHGDIPATARVVKIFQSAFVDAVFHCGDIGSFDVLSELAVLQVPVHVVLGNIDEASEGWKFFPSDLGVWVEGRFVEVELGGIRIALLHGDNARRFDQVVSSEEYDLVLSGHTHAVHDYQEGATRCINPGAAGRGAPRTCAVLDLTSGLFQVFKL